MPNAVVQEVQEQGNNLGELFTKDCKQAASLFRSYLWPRKPSQEDLKLYVTMMNLSESTIHPLVPSWLTAVEKARHKIALEKQAHVLYRWIILENGESEFQGKFVSELSLRPNEIELEVTHLNPRENGYSKDYGFPNLDLFEKNGFKDIFKITEEGVLDERFKILPSGDSFKGIDDIDDPEGFADYLADPEYHDLY